MHRLCHVIVTRGWWGLVPSRLGTQMRKTRSKRVGWVSGSPRIRTIRHTQAAARALSRLWAATTRLHFAWLQLAAQRENRHGVGATMQIIAREH